jgi:hypothetical protein
MTKETFIQVLDILESDYIIDSYDLIRDKNAIRVLSCDSIEDATYTFNQDNELINPQIKKIQKQIDELEEQKKLLEKRLKVLTNN